MKRKVFLGIGVILLFIGLLGVGGLLSITPGIIGDTYISRQNPSTNYGNANNLESGNIEQGFGGNMADDIEDIAFIGFDININYDNITIHNAQLTLHAFDANSQPTISTCAAIPRLGWTESSLTWNNRPPLTMDSDACSNTDISNGENIRRYGTFVEYNVTDYFIFWQANRNNPNITNNSGFESFAIITYFGHLSFQSSEGAVSDEAPKLVINYEAPTSNGTENKTAEIKNNNIDTKDDKGKDTNNDLGAKEAPWWAWILIVVGVALILIAAVRRR